jgi:hypothetical protein
MHRRDFVRSVFSVGLAPKLLLSQQSASAPPPPAPVAWTLGLNPLTPVPKTEIAEAAGEPLLVFFSQRQMATLTRLSDVLLPPIGNKPGAVQARTPQFLDFLIDGSPTDRKKIYSGGLDWLDAESQRVHHMPFAKLTSQQADDLLRPWMRTWMSDHPPTEQHADFINIAHDDIRTATINSQAWNNVPSAGAQQATAVGLYFSPIEPDLRGTGAAHSHMAPHVVAAAKAAHPTPTYPR